MIKKTFVRQDKTTHIAGRHLLTIPKLRMYVCAHVCNHFMILPSKLELKNERKNVFFML